MVGLASILNAPDLRRQMEAKENAVTDTGEGEVEQRHGGDLVWSCLPFFASLLTLLFDTHFHIHTASLTIVSGSLFIPLPSLPLP